MINAYVICPVERDPTPGLPAPAAFRPVIDIALRQLILSRAWITPQGGNRPLALCRVVLRSLPSEFQLQACGAILIQDRNEHGLMSELAPGLPIDRLAALPGVDASFGPQTSFGQWIAGLIAQINGAP